MPLGVSFLAEDALASLGTDALASVGTDAVASAGTDAAASGAVGSGLSDFSYLGDGTGGTVDPSMTGSPGGGTPSGSSGFNPMQMMMGTSLLSSLFGSNAAKSASNTQADASRYATNAQLQMFNTLQNNLRPYLTAGYGALDQLTAGTQPGGQFTHQFNADDLNSNLAPNYAFMLGQGQGATQNLSNLSGGLLSGNSLKAINDYTQNYASNAYQQAFENYTANQTNIFNRLSGIAGLGQTANQVSGQAGASYAPGIANTITGAGQAQAAGTVGAANAWASGLNNVGTWAMLSQMGNKNGNNSSMFGD